MSKSHIVQASITVVFQYCLSFLSRIDERDSFYNISQFISSEPEPFNFLPFSVKIYSSPHSGQDDVLSDSYSCVIEHALWKVRALSAAEASLASPQHAVNSMEAPQTVNCQAINSLSSFLCLSLNSYRPHLEIIGRTGEKVPFLIIQRIMRFELFPNANTQIAAVHLCIRWSILPFHLASVADGLQLIFAHLI